MLREELDEKRLQYLSNQIASMHFQGVDHRSLADIALEVLVTRAELENIVKERKYPKQRRERAKKNIESLKELEKSLVSLYFLGKLKGEKWTERSVFDSIVRRYRYER